MMVFLISERRTIISLLNNFSDVLVSEMILVGIAVEVCISLICTYIFLLRRCRQSIRRPETLLKFSESGNVIIDVTFRC